MPTTLMAQARGHIQRLDANLPVLDAKTLAEQAGASLDDLRMTARMLLTFGVAAMGLAAMGIYGLVSYTVKQSTHEIGIRMALGAQPGDVVRRFLGRGLRLGAHRRRGRHRRVARCLAPARDAAVRRQRDRHGVVRDASASC